jgi:hypothetical protein
MKVKARVTTGLAFGFAAAIVSMFSLLVFGPPAKESRSVLAVLVTVSAVSASVASLLLTRVEQRTSGQLFYHLGFMRGAVAGLGSVAVFLGAMAGLTCASAEWLECLVRALDTFGFVMGIPAVLVSGLLGLLLEEIFAG